jgi:hypothetical protein
MNNIENGKDLPKSLSIIELESKLLDSAASPEAILESLYKELTSINSKDSSTPTDQDKAILQILKATAEAISKTNRTIKHQAEMLTNIKADLKAYKLRVPPALQKDSFLSRLENQLDELGS